MAMVLFYNRINWEDFPSVNTAINALRLNAMDYAAKLFDERTCELYNTKAEQSTVLNTIQDWSLDEDSGIITITKVNGEQIMFDLNIEKIPVKFELSEDGILTMTTDDGSKFTANIGAMIPVIVFENSDTISVTKKSNRTELATNFSKYVHEFESAFTGNIVVKVVPLGDSTGQYNATLVYENGTMDIKSGGGVDEEEFVFAVESLSKITVSSLTSNNIVALYEEVVTNEIRYRFDVKEGSIKDKHLEPNYLAKIKVQAENAELSATASAESATTASEKAIVAESYAVGGTGTRDGEDTDNAKYYAESVSGAVGDIALNRQTLGYVKKNLLNPELLTNTSVAWDGTDRTFSVLCSADKKAFFKDTFKENTAYTISGYVKHTSVNYAAFIAVYKDGTYDGGTVSGINEYAYTELTTDASKTLDYIGVRYWGGTTTFKELQIEVGSTATDYEPYVDDVDTRLKALTPVNNLLTTVPGSPLDAVMGKALADRLTALEGKIEIKQLSVTVNSGGYTNTIPINPDEYILLEVVQAEYIEPRSVFRLYPRYEDGKKDYSAYVTDVKGTTQASEGEYNILCVCIKR